MKTSDNKGVKKNYGSAPKIFFLMLFFVAGLIALQIPVAHVAGSKATFTVYDSFAPIAGAFLGSIPGAITVLMMQVANFFLHGAVVQDIGTIIRFFPMIFGVLYFARKTRADLIIPFIAIVAFLAHPIGRQVWYFSLFWIIPIAAHFFRDRFLFIRALGATFSAHAVGGALWIWAFALPVSVWNSLIPIVAIERILFAVGISFSFVAAANVLSLIASRTPFRVGVWIDERYLLPFLRRRYERTGNPAA